MFQEHGQKDFHSEKRGHRIFEEPGLAIQDADDISRELVKATSRFEDLWSNAPVGYVLHDRLGQIVMANRKAQTLLKQNAALQSGDRLQQYLSEESARAFTDRLQSQTDHREVNCLEVRLSGGGDHWLQLESMVTSAGEIRTTLFDISKQKRAEQDRFKLARQLQQTQKMEVLHELSAGIAHDFNNILQVVMTYGEFVFDDLKEIGANTDSISAMLAGAERGADLTRRLLAFSRKSSLQAEALDLRDVVSNATEVVRRTLGELIRVRVQLPDDSVLVCVDRNLIEQAILNLCVNARDAMPNGGHITLTLDTVEFAATTTLTGTELPPGDYAVLAVVDDGLGMDESVLEKVFEPFFTTKDIGAGTGLGLSIVYGITRQHQGAIESSSVPDKGSQFRIFLPLTTLEPHRKPSEIRPSADLSPAHSGRILLAEDETAIRLVVSRSLQNAGYTVTTASDGKEAIGLIEQEEVNFDLLLTDAVMPGASGKEVCEKFRERWADTPVVILSGHGDQVVDNEFLKRHAATLLAKPIPSRDLMEIVHRTIHPSPS